MPVVNDASVNLLGEFVVSQGTEDLSGEFVVGGPVASVDLAAEFVVLGGNQDLPAEFVSRNATTVGASDAAGNDPILLPSQRAAFYAAGRRWIFYSNGINLAFRSNTDAVAWSAETLVRPCTSGEQFAIHFDGTYVHYAYASPTYGSQGGIWYCRGEPQSNGTITWSSVEQKPIEPGEAGNRFLTPTVSVDSSGYPWVVWVLYDSEGPSYRLYSVRSANNDGTWSGAEGGDSLASGLDATSCPRLVPLRARRMYCLWDASGEILGKLFSDIDNPTVWGSTEDSGADIAGSRLYDAISYLDHVHLVWTEEITLKIQHKKRVYGTGWGTSHEIYDAVLADMGPAISRGSQEGPKLYVFWAPDENNPTADHVFYKVSTDDGVNWAAQVDWIDDSVDTFPLPNQQSAFEVQGEFYIGCVWVRSSPDDIRYYELEDDANGFEDLAAEFEVGQGAEDLPGEVLVRHSDTEEFPGEFIVQHEDSADLAAAFDGQTSVDLLGEFLVRHAASVELPAELIIRHEASVDLFAELIVRHSAFFNLAAGFIGQAVLNLSAEFVVRHSATVDLSAEFIVRHSASEDLPAEVVVRHSASVELLGEFIVRHSASVELPAEFIIRHASATTLGDLYAKFAVRSVYPYWTDRRYINGVIDAAEGLIGDAKLEFIIEGVMDDIKVWAAANTVSYDSWTNIDITPTAIKRATTYGVVAALYARHTKTFQGRVIPTMAPVTVTVTGDEEKAMDHWAAKTEEMLQLYLTAQGFARIWISTEDEEPVFTMADIPADITDETSWLEWLRLREV